MDYSFSLKRSLLLLALVLGPLGATRSEAHPAGTSGEPLVYQGLSLPQLRLPQQGPQKEGQMEGQIKEGQQEQGYQKEVQQTEGQQTEGQQTRGQQTEGQKTEGQKTQGQQTEGQQTEGQRTQGQQAEGQKTEGQQVEGREGPSSEQQRSPGQQEQQQLLAQVEGERARAQLLEVRAPIKCPSRCKACMPGNCKALTCCTQDLVSQRCTRATRLVAGCKRKKGPKTVNCANVKDLAAGLETIQTMLSIQMQDCKSVKQYYTFVGRLTKQVVALRKTCC